MNKRKKSFKPRGLPSTQALDLMSRALQGLDKTIATSGSRNVPEISLQEVEKACLEIETSLKARGLLRNARRLTRLFVGLEHYGRSIDVLCNGTQYLCWIWSPITVVLRMASDCVSAFEIIMKAYTKVGDTLGRFLRLRDTFFENHRFQELLAVFYSDILQLHGLAYKFAQRSGWEAFLLTTCGRFERRFGNIVENLERHADLIDKEGSVLSICEIQKSLRELLSRKQEDLQQIKDEEKEESTRQYVDIISRLRIDEQDQLAIFESFSECLKFAGTCGWAIQEKSISSWLNPVGLAQSLWLHGSAGTGKSVLSAHLITYKRSDLSSRVIYHFCSDQYSESKKYDQILRSIIRQLLQISDEAMGHVHNTFLKNRKVPSLLELERLVEEILAIVSGELADNTGPVWVVVDGVDECEAGKLHQLVNLLTGRPKGRGKTGLSSPKNAPCKVMFTSRRGPASEKGLRGLSVVSLGEDNIKGKVQAAIGCYVSDRLHSTQTFGRLQQLDIGTQELKEIRDDIVQKADGMFLYARLILDYLGSQLFRHKDDFREQVSCLPKTLREFYSKLLGHIISQMNSKSCEIVKCIFRWVAFARRPLRKLEFLSAITFSAGDSSTYTLVPAFVLEECANLVEVRHDKTVSFIHGSVKEFLTSPDADFIITEQEATEEQAIASATCLLSTSQCFRNLDVERTRRIRVVKGLYSLALYSSEYWVEYNFSMAERDGSERRKYFNTIASLIAELERPEWRAETEPRHFDSEAVALEPRLALLHEYPVLQHHASCAINSRSQGGLEAGINISGGSIDGAQSRKKSPDAVSRILEAYQETVRWLLSQDYCADVPTEDLEAFKAEFCRSTFTCRLRFCPRATVGFKSEELLKEHEWAHSSRPRCTFSRCQYPPLASSQALKRHVDMCHSPARTVGRLRRVSKMQESREGGSIGGRGVGTPVSQPLQDRLIPAPAGSPQLTAMNPATKFTSNIHTSNIHALLQARAPSPDLLPLSPFQPYHSYSPDSVLEAGADPRPGQQPTQPTVGVPAATSQNRQQQPSQLLLTSASIKTMSWLIPEEKAEYQAVLDGLWNSFNSAPPDSTEAFTAHDKIQEYCRNLMEGNQQQIKSQALEYWPQNWQRETDIFTANAHQLLDVTPAAANPGAGILNVAPAAGAGNLPSKVLQTPGADIDKITNDLVEYSRESIRVLESYNALSSRRRKA